MREKDAQEGKALMIVFELSGEHWGIGIDHVQEVLEVRGITPVPKVPDFILGIMNCRGKILTIVDLAVVIGKKSAKEEGKRILHLKSEDMDVGLFVGSKIRIDSLSRDFIKNDTLVEGGVGEHQSVVEGKIALSDKTELSLLDGSKIVDWLEHYQFK
jgi:purine-binding chemotaxis protein CheW